MTYPSTLMMNCWKVGNKSLKAVCHHSLDIMDTFCSLLLYSVSI